MTRIDTNKMGLNKSSKFANTAKNDNDDKKYTKELAIKNLTFTYFLFLIVSENNLSWL